MKAYSEDLRTKILEALQQESKALTRMRSRISLPVISSGIGGTACWFNRYDERCRHFGE